VSVSKTETGLMRLSKDFEDAEECAGVLVVEKDLYFTTRMQVKQSVPIYFDRTIMDKAAVRFEFELPTSVIKIQRDKKNLARQYGAFTTNEFALNAQANMDLFYQFNNYGPISMVIIILAAVFGAAKINRRFDFILIPLLAIAIAFIFAGIVILAIGESPFAALGAIFKGAFGSQTATLNMLLAATPLIFTGLAVAFAFNCGLFNIGGESQLMIGAFAAAVCGYYLELSPYIHIPLVILAAALAAGFFASIAGWLKERFEIHEVISTIMLNYAAYSLLGYLVLMPCFKENGPNPQTKEILSSAVLAPFFHRHALNYGLIIAILAAVFIWFLLYRTTTGFNIRAVGLNPAAAEYSGVSVSKMIVFSMFVSGALAGLGGAERVMGVFLKYNSTAFVGYGFDGIAVALLVNNNPIGVIFSAALFGFLKTGGAFMNREIGIPVELVIIIQAVIIFFMALSMAAPLFITGTGAIFSERCGVINIALEAMMLIGAFFGVIGSYYTGSPWTGVLCGIAAAGVFAALHALICIKYKSNQVVSGVALNMLASGLTVFLVEIIFGMRGTSENVATIPNINAMLGFAADSKGSFLYKALDFSPLILLGIIAVFVSNAVLFKTVFGLRLRAVGEHAKAADTLGINVSKMRYAGVIISGLLAGLAGAFLSLSLAGNFRKDMTAGRGYIALAAMIIGKWKPVNVFVASLFFGFAQAAETFVTSLVIFGYIVPPQFIQMLPYVLTLIILAGFVGKAVPPHDLGKPYSKEEKI
jgi:simple sugar transport system permease protein